MLMHPVVRLFDALQRRWEGPVTQRRIGTLLVISFLAALLVVELNRQGLVPAPLSALLSRNHFRAVTFTFTLLLIAEVIGLVFALAQSVANSVGKQFELFALILLREAFLEVGHYGEPIAWERASESILAVLSDIGGALVVFVLIGLYYRAQQHQPITSGEEERVHFIATKKAISLVLLTVFVVLGVRMLMQPPRAWQVESFFATIYTVLIFSDVLMVLVSLRYSTNFAVVFRNSGFAAVTVILRLALTAPPYVNSLLGLAAMLLALGLTLAYNGFAPLLFRRDEGGTHGGRIRRAS